MTAPRDGAIEGGLWVLVERSEDELSTWAYGPFPEREDGRTFVDATDGDWDDLTWKGNRRFQTVAIVAATRDGLIR